jgi:hypothetical protein
MDTSGVPLPPLRKGSKLTKLDAAGNASVIFFAETILYNPG